MARTSTAATITGDGCAASLLYSATTISTPPPRKVTAITTLDTILASPGARGARIVVDVRGTLIGEPTRKIDVTLSIAGTPTTVMLAPQPDDPNLYHRFEGKLSGDSDLTSIALKIGPTQPLRADEQLLIELGTVDFGIVTRDCPELGKPAGKQGAA